MSKIIQIHLSMVSVFDYTLTRCLALGHIRRRCDTAMTSPQSARRQHQRQRTSTVTLTFQHFATKTTRFAVAASLHQLKTFQLVRADRGSLPGPFVRRLLQPLLTISCRFGRNRFHWHRTSTCGACGSSKVASAVKVWRRKIPVLPYVNPSDHSVAIRL